MRICFVSPEFVTEPSYAGGLANYLGRVTVALKERGHDVHVLIPAHTEESIDYCGVHVHRVLPVWDRRMILDRVLDRFFMNDLYNPYQETKAARSLWCRWKQLRRDLQFDLVQAANVRAAGLFFRYEKNVPVVTRMSNYSPLWDSASGSRLHRGKKWRWTLEEWATRGTTYVYAPSHFVARKVRENYRLSAVDVIETPFFMEQTCEDDSVFHQQGFAEKPYFLFFGCMTQMKGVHILAQALQSVLQRLPNVHAVFIGQGEAPAPNGVKMREYIATQAGAMADRLHILNQMPHNMLYPFVRHARLVVIPSLFDNLPNTCLEAMGLGRMVIATSDSCFEQLISHGRSGWLVPPNNVVALGDAIVHAWSLSETDQHEVERSAAQRIAELHPNQAVPRLIAYYKQVIADFQSKAVKKMFNCLRNTLHRDGTHNLV